jgi:hypothetical protein
VRQSQCEVCAVSLSDVEDAVRRMVLSQPRIMSLGPNDLVTVFRDIRKVTEALGAPGAVPGWWHGAVPLEEVRVTHPLAVVEAVEDSGRRRSAWVLAHDGRTLWPANGSLASNLMHRLSRSLLSLFFAIFVAPPWFGHGSLPVQSEC